MTTGNELMNDNHLCVKKIDPADFGVSSVERCRIKKLCGLGGFVG
jgi:hypothetical protein